MKLLALDTATEACSAALWLNGEVVERFRLAPREHNRLILPMIEELLAEAGISLQQLDALAFGRGPGSFTGVRIATGVVQGIAYATGLPVAGVSTLAAMALEATTETGCDHALPCIDARMGEVYWAVYRASEESGCELIGAEAVLAPDAVAFPRNARCVAIGSGWDSYAARMQKGLNDQPVDQILLGRFPRAAHVARLGAGMVARGLSVAAADAQPVYLRDNVAKKPGESR